MGSTLLQSTTHSTANLQVIAAIALVTYHSVADVEPEEAIAPVLRDNSIADPGDGSTDQSSEHSIAGVGGYRLYQ